MQRTDGCRHFRADQRRPDERRLHGDHADAERSELERRRFRESLNTVFRGAVRGRLCETDGAEDRADVDDGTAWPARFITRVVRNGPVRNLVDCTRLRNLVFDDNNALHSDECIMVEPHRTLLRRANGQAHSSRNFP